MSTASSSQEHSDEFDRIACVHISGLLVRSHMNAGLTVTGRSDHAAQAATGRAAVFL